VLSHSLSFYCLIVKYQNRYIFIYRPQTNGLLIIGTEKKEYTRIIMDSSTLEMTRQREEETQKDLPSIDSTITQSEDDDDDVDDDEESMFKTLLPPTPNYKHNDEDLDELLGIELNTINNDNTPKRRHTTKVSTDITKQSKMQQKKCCVKKYGNTIILHTTCHNKTKYGLMGPHYPGVIFTVGLLFGASFYFTQKAFHDVGAQSGYVCIMFTIFAFHNLLRIVCVDPGIVKLQDQLERRKRKKAIANENSNDDIGKQGDTGDYEIVNIGDEQGWRYCGACSLYQPPKAAHCPDCNVCINEYDHHCPWMGTCIGKNNMPAFMRFNFTWLIYLFYSCLWVLAFGPLSVKKQNI
jgi:hypothetical protein